MQLDKPFVKYGNLLLMNVGDGPRMVEKRVAVKLVAEVWRETHSAITPPKIISAPTGLVSPIARPVPALDLVST